MTNYSVDNVDDYIEAAPQEARSHLAEIRAAVKSAVPEVEEGIKWGKPYYQHPAGMLSGYDAYKHHIGFEVWADKLPDDDRNKLEEKGYKTTKRTFHIRYDQEVPATIIKRMVKAQAKLNKDKDGNK